MSINFDIYYIQNIRVTFHMKLIKHGNCIGVGCHLNLSLRGLQRWWAIMYKMDAIYMLKIWKFVLLDLWNLFVLLFWDPFVLIALSGAHIIVMSR